MTDENLDLFPLIRKYEEDHETYEDILKHSDVIVQDFVSDKTDLYNIEIRIKEYELEKEILKEKVDTFQKVLDKNNELAFEAKEELKKMKKKILDKINYVDYTIYEKLPDFVIKWREKKYGKYAA